jgi:hypothetical protein
MIDIIGLMMLAEGEPKPHRRRTEGDCGAPVGPVDLLGTEFAFAVVFVYNLFENCQYGH